MASESDTNSATSRPDGVRVTADECPRCGKAVAPRFRPFCSERCSDLDLAGWLTGKYRLPTEEVADPNDPSPVSEDNEGGVMATRTDVRCAGQGLYSLL